jgi:hypothetical protein
MSRKHNREHAALLERLRALETASSEPESISTPDIILWCLAGVVAIGLYLAPEKNRLTVCLGLVGMALLATHPTLHLRWVNRASSIKGKIINSVVSIFFMLLLVVIYGRLVWPATPYYHNLTSAERTTFINTLTSQKEPREELKFLCPVTREDLCVIATDYLEMFQRAGWKTPNGGIERGMYGKSFSGITIAKRPDGGIADPNNPDIGLWVQQSPSLVTIESAFRAVQMPLKASADQALPEGMISVYFGPAP